MLKIGRFLEYSMPADDIRASLEFYRALGLTELATGDIRRHPYAVLTDGRIAIGLHAGFLDETALSFVFPDLATHVRSLDDPAAAFEFFRVGLDEFHEAGLRDPGGQLLLLMEARTFSAFDPEDITAPWIGQCAEISLAATDAAGSTAFWSAAGLVADEPGPDDVPRLLAPGLRLALASGGHTGPRFRTADADAARTRLEVAGIAWKETPSGLVIQAPEGTRLLLMPMEP
jgi:catechol 2,3-dioxygenase-like lactoylglutathione lyase family enzyme